MESSPECAFSLTTTFSTQSSEPPPTPPNYLRTLELWERRWALAPNIQKCHRLTVANKNNRIPISYILHNQTLETVAMAKYRGVELTENLHPGKHILCTAAKANRVSAFAYANPRGCPSAVQTHCYTGPLTSGVPQGSVIGPSLFLIYINDLGDGTKPRVRLFADDNILCSVIRTATDSTQLQDDLRTLDSWERRWLMSFNTSAQAKEQDSHQLYPPQPNP